MWISIQCHQIKLNDKFIYIEDSNYKLCKYELRKITGLHIYE